ncbi:MAG: hypothetical protein V4592_17785 [Bacteroidota bacterium]
MTKLDELKNHLAAGQVYRRADLAQWSKSVDRHLNELVQQGLLNKLAGGLYYVPKLSAFGQTPPEEDALVRGFLKDERFLLTSPNVYNSLGLGTTQLYNQRTVYNHKRHGKFKLGNRTFNFQVKPHFPNHLSEEFLVVDLVNNLTTLAEDQQDVLKKLAVKIAKMDKPKLKQAIADYGGARARKLLPSLLAGNTNSVYGS